jgi:hypothetical protein
MMRRFRFSPVLLQTPAFSIGDRLIVLGIAAVLYVGALASKPGNVYLSARFIKPVKFCCVLRTNQSMIILQ